MRTLRALSVLALVVFLVTPAAIAANVESSNSTTSIDLKASPSKVCHPKSTVACRTTDLKALEEQSNVKTAFICAGPRWSCKANTLPLSVDKKPVETAFICAGPRWSCKTNTLN